MTAAGYISDQSCPTHPEHGPVIASKAGNGVFCPHAEHTTPGNHTQAWWGWDEWEKAKANPPTVPARKSTPKAQRLKPRKKKRPR